MASVALAAEATRQGLRKKSNSSVASCRTKNCVGSPVRTSSPACTVGAKPKYAGWPGLSGHTGNKVMRMSREVGNTSRATCIDVVLREREVTEGRRIGEVDHVGVAVFEFEAERCRGVGIEIAEGRVKRDEGLVAGARRGGVERQRAEVDYDQHALDVGIEPASAARGSFTGWPGAYRTSRSSTSFAIASSALSPVKSSAG